MKVNYKWMNCHKLTNNENPNSHKSINFTEMIFKKQYFFYIQFNYISLSGIYILYF